MAHYFAALTLLLLVGMVLTRVMLMRRQGIRAMNFGKIDKTDFLILPFAAFYFYVVFAAAFGWSSSSQSVFLQSEIVEWIGVLFCATGLLLMLFSLISFRQSFRVGIDIRHPDQLITSGAFAISRNPIYTAFGLVLLGQFLILPGWIMLVYLTAGVALFHRQVLREESFLKQHYGEEYVAYTRRVRRYL